MSKTERKDESRSEYQAKSQLESIREMVAALEAAGDDDTAREEAEQTIHEDPLSVEVRGDWYQPGSKAEKPCRYRILLCWGGPACRIIGDLDQYGQPETAEIEHQDWRIPWTELHTSNEDEKVLLTYARCFYFEQ